ncbi:probable serine/threonine-protein kinase At1g54610 [Cajanus cajan]|uniref:Serine/threonine-protein kinase At1g54610 family n=1 Tax=Cajanus cajan TaxID=3821 RepID=A0A151TL74_CAJCA|nr:probable serine/threonine-protein kinase At1g54610 [Cajanus cajan]KYP67804.1 putative serine/threonine-protein kinase At1g54610 family [Cajanus cajan]
MGCINTKLTPPRNQNHNTERLKPNKDHANTASPPTHVEVRLEEDINKKVSSEKENRDSTSKVVKGVPRNDDKSEVGNVSERSEEKKNIARNEFVEGWPKWLVDNIPPNVLATLVPKSADSYEKLGKVGRGTYSNVYKARDKDTGKIVALKKVKFDTSDPESIKFMAREIVILQTLDHPNVIKLEGLATSRMQYSLYLVFDHMKSDLTRIISRPGEKLTEPQIKCYMQQLLLGLHHCHERGVMHRDIKPSNLLVDKKGVLKIADFGLANSFAIKPEGPFTNRVVTLWYRAPELLLGSTHYGYSIDLWSAGCLLAEMFHGRPIMPGRTEVEQIHMIFKLCGSPSADYWMKTKLMTSFRPPPHYKANYEENFKDFPSSACALLTTLLHLHSDSRGTAASALESEFFKSSPLACDPSALPVIYNDEDERSQTKRRKRRKGLKNKGQVFQTSASNVSHSRKNQTAEQRWRDSESSKEKRVLQNMKGEETRNSGSSSAWSFFMNERSMSMNASLSPLFLSSVRKSPRTEGHPNALKNIKNYALLQASIIDVINRNESSEIGPLRKSFSALDFRLDQEKLSSFYGPNNKLGNEM